MKYLFILLAALAVMSSCTEEVEVPVIQIDTLRYEVKVEVPKVVRPKVLPEIDTLSKAFVGEWKTSVLYYQKGFLGSDRVVMNNPEAISNICKGLDTLLQAKDLVKGYKITYHNDTLLVEKSYICSTRVDYLIWEIKLTDDHGVYTPQLYTSHPFMIIEKNLQGRVLTNYRMIFFNINKFPNDQYTPKNLFRSDVIYDYREQNPKPTYYSIDFTKK